LVVTLADQQGNDRIRRVIEKGAQLAGALTGGAVGLFGGPAGALGGATAGWATGEA
jgi:hypothetical protein